VLILSFSRDVNKRILQILYDFLLLFILIAVN